jgi:endonuclease/exonuclease/phosphatase family metal-dependent hydrolase
MKKLKLVFTITCVFFTALQAQNETSMKLATFNIKGENGSNVGDFMWNNRKQYVAQLINDYGFDIFGMQEIGGVTGENQLMEYLSATYSIVSYGTGNSAGAIGERNGIAYRTSRFTKLADGFFFISTRPDQAGKGWDAALNRIAVWAQFLDINTNQTFYFFALHLDHVGVVAREKGSAFVATKVKDIAGQSPVFCVGDFNFSLLREPQAYTNMTQYLNDSRTVSATPPEGFVGTGNSQDVTLTAFNCDEYRRGDFIFTNANVQSYAVISDKYVEGAYPSDHFPVVITADLSLKLFPIARFAEFKQIKHLPYDGVFTNEFTGSFTGPVNYASSNTNCATINGDGQVTLLNDGETTITATTTETDELASVSKSYLLRVFTQHEHTVETFVGAATTRNTYLNPSQTVTSAATGISWTVFLGSIRADPGRFGNNAVIMRGKMPTSEIGLPFANVFSSTIHGGIDNLSFDWDSNWSEAGRALDIRIFINDTEIDRIAQPETAPVDPPFNKYSINNLKIQGDFIIKIVNNSTASTEANQYHFVFGNLEWTSYYDPSSTPVVDSLPMKSIRKRMSSISNR